MQPGARQAGKGNGMEYPNWSARYKAIAKHYRRQLQIASGKRCEFCEEKLPEDSEYGACEGCTKTLVDAISEPATRTLNGE